MGWPFSSRDAMAPEQRAVTSLDWVTGADSGAGKSIASAMSIVPVYASARLIVDALSTKPLQQFRESGDARRSVPLAPVFAQEKLTRWFGQALMSAVIRGNAFGLTVAFGQSGPGKVAWLNPEHMDVDESGSLPVFRYKGVEVPRDQLVHVPGLPVPGSVLGLSPVGALRSLATTGTATQSMMAEWFEGRAIPGAIFKNTMMQLVDTESEALAKRLDAKLRHGKPLVHGKDWEFTPVTLSADDAAFISSAKMNASQWAAVFGVPPEKVGGEAANSLTYSTVELNAINLATETLAPWARRFEEEFSSWLPAREYVKFNLDAGIRVDTKTRYEVHQIARNIGLNNTDELRALEDLPPLPNGQGQDYTPLASKGPTTTPTTREQQ